MVIIYQILAFFYGYKNPALDKINTKKETKHTESKDLEEITASDSQLNTIRFSNEDKTRPYSHGLNIRITNIVVIGRESYLRSIDSIVGMCFLFV